MQLFIGNISENTAVLTEEESRHFTKVLRGQIGKKIRVTDGTGTMAEGVVSQISSKSVTVDLNAVEHEYEKRPYKLHMAIAPTKSMDRIEVFLEKATEIGIDEITFLKTFHSERKNINISRCEKIVQAAAKQSLKAYFPKVNDLVKFSDFIQKDFSDNKLIAHCDTQYERKDYKSILKSGENYLILIGPEGDFSTLEIEEAEKNGFIGISLGNQRLRTETAALSAVFGMNWENTPS